MSILLILLPFVKYSLLETESNFIFFSSMSNIFNIKEQDIKLDTVSNNDYLTKGNNINKIDILFKKIEKNND